MPGWAPSRAPATTATPASARACGKSAVHDLEPEDMRAMTIEASAITGIPLVGTNFAFRPESFAQAVVEAMAAASANGHVAPQGAHT